MSMDWKLKFINISTNPTLIYELKAIAIKKSSTGFCVCVEIHKLLLLFLWKCKEPRIGKYFGKKKEQESFVIYQDILQSCITKGMWHCQRMSTYNKSK